MVWRGELIALGEGGPKEPHRYFFHPVFLATHRDSEPYQAALDADPGTKLAVAMEMAKFNQALRQVVDGLETWKASEAGGITSPSHHCLTNPS